MRIIVSIIFLRLVVLVMLFAGILYFFYRLYRQSNPA